MESILRNNSENSSREQTNHTFLFRGDVRIRYQIEGQGHPILMLHGFGASLETWNEVRPALANDFKLILVDLKGFGASSRRRDAHYSLSDQVEILLALLGELGIQYFGVVGHSYGGVVALMLHRSLASPNHTGRLSHLALLDTPGHLKKLPFFVELLRSPIAGWAAMHLASPKLRARYTLDRLFFDRRLVTPERVERYAKYYGIRGSGYSFRQSAEQVVPPNVNAILDHVRTIRTPTSLIWGREDYVVPIEYGYMLNALIATSTLTLLDDCGHIPNEEKPRETAAILSSFLRHQ